MSIVANVVGLPGFIRTRPKCSVQSGICSNNGFTKSCEPIDTPPLVTNISTCCKALIIATRSCFLSSGAIPKSIVAAPAVLAAANNIGRFESLIFQLPGVVEVASTSSSPVDMTPITGLRRRGIEVGPTEANKAISAGPKRHPSCSTVVLVATSEPISLIHLPSVLLVCI